MVDNVETPDTDKTPDTKGHNIVTARELQDLNETIGAFENQLTESDAQIAKNGEATGETTAKLEALNEAIQVKEDALTKRFDALEAKLARKSLHDTGSSADNSKKSERTELFFSIFHAKNTTEKEKRENAYYASYDGAPKNLKTLIVGDNVLGGFNAPPEFVEEMIMTLQEQNPVRGLFKTRTTAKRAIQVPKQVGHPTAQWVSELESRTETTGITYGRIEIPAHEMHGQVNVSREDMEDSYFDLESTIRSELSEQFARAEGVAFIDGSGAGKPEGLLTNADVAGITSGDAASFGADDLISVYYEPLDSYIANSTFLMKRAVIKHVRQLKDGEGNYIWAAGLQRDARPATILDRPYVAADQMPGLGSSNVCVLFGDFRAAYTIVDRIIMEVITDIFSGKATGTVEFSARKRVGGKVVLAQALKSLTCGA